jgi:hypothetical protein
LWEPPYAAGIAGAVANKFLSNSSPAMSGIGKDGVLYKVARKSSTGEWTVTAYVPDGHHGWKRHEGKTYYGDSKEDAVGTFNYIMGPKGPTMMNPLTAKETRRVLRASLMDARTAKVFQKGPTRSSMIGQALGRAETAHQFGARSKRKLSSRVLDTIHTVSHNRGGRWYGSEASSPMSVIGPV